MARWIVGALCVGVLVVGATGWWSPTKRGAQLATTTQPADPRQWDADHRYAAQFDCIRDQITAQVPAGSTVYISDQTGSPDPDLWLQRLADLSFRQATVVASRDQADYQLKVVPAPTATTAVDPSTTASPGPASCYGVRLELTAR